MGNWNGLYYYGTVSCNDDCEVDPDALGWGVRTTACTDTGCDNTDDECSCYCDAKAAPKLSTEAQRKSVGTYAQQVLKDPNSSTRRKSAAAAVLKGLKNWSSTKKPTAKFRRDLLSLTRRQLLVEFYQTSIRRYLTVSDTQLQSTKYEFNPSLPGVGDDDLDIPSLRAPITAETRHIPREVIDGPASVIGMVLRNDETNEDERFYFRLKEIRLRAEDDDSVQTLYLRVGQQVDVPDEFDNFEPGSVLEKGRFAHIIEAGSRSGASRRPVQYLITSVDDLSGYSVIPGPGPDPDPIPVPDPIGSEGEKRTGK